MPARKSILIIESDHDTRVIIRQALEGEGYSVRSVTNVNSAFEQIKKYATVGLIIFGMCLPFTDSADFIKAKSSDPSIESIPVIILADAEEKVASPVAGILRQPLLVTELIALVRRILS